MSNYLKAFISGIILPSILLPIALFFAVGFGKPQVLTVPLVHVIPLIWGIWNVLYFAFFREMLPAHMNVRLLLTGAVLGFLVALVGIFWLHLPTLLGLEEWRFYPLLAAPILYGILWRFAVKPLNDLLGLYDK